ncbi:MAG: pilin [Zoogloeaceae bacterium]|jgi:hypothetical protein|nr:pilin [Zoogloeaceae bacterium]
MRYEFTPQTKRFRVTRHDGSELILSDAPLLLTALHKGEISETMLLFDANSGKRASVSAYISEAFASTQKPNKDGKRFRVTRQDGSELSFSDVSTLLSLIRKKEISEATPLLDVHSGRRAPVGAHISAALGSAQDSNNAEKAELTLAPLRAPADINEAPKKLFPLGKTLLLLPVALLLGILLETAVSWGHSQNQKTLANSQAERALGDLRLMSVAIETCLNEGRLKMGQGEGECAPNYACSPLLVGAKQDGSAACTPGMGIPQTRSPKALDRRENITATFGPQAAPLLQGKTLVIQRYGSGPKNGVWHCDSTASTVENQYRPPSCQGK